MGGECEGRIVETSEVGKEDPESVREVLTDEEDRDAVLADAPDVPKGTPALNR